jgi:hypothetical protein
MIKTAALISFSAYCWFLAFFYEITKTYPSPQLVLIQLLLVFGLPAVLGCRTTRTLLYKGPTLWKLVYVNGMAFLAYTAASIWSFLYLLGAGSPTVWPLSRSAAQYDTVWQLAMWLCGALLAVNAGKRKLNLTRSGILWISFSAVPAILLLAGMGFSATAIITAVAAWYFLLAFSLAADQNVPRHCGFLLLHSLVPCLMATLAITVVFTSEFKLLLDGLLRALMAVKDLLLWLLSFIFREPKAYEADPDWLDSLKKDIRIPEEKEAADPTLLFCLGAVVFVVVAGTAVWNLYKLLRTRLAPVERRAPAAKRSLFSELRAALKQILRFARNLGKCFPAACRFLLRGIVRMKNAVVSGIRTMLPPRSPQEAIERAYLRFLRWGRRRMRVRRNIAETPLEYANRLEKAAAEPSFPGQDVLTLTDCFLQVKYGGQGADWKTARQCAGYLKNIKKRRGP